MENNTGPLLIDAKSAAKLCGVSRSMWYKLLSMGSIPRPRRLGRRVLWGYEEIRAWDKQGRASVAL